MFGRCFFCHRPLPSNDALEYFRFGRRVAFDPAQGRLWAVCPSCLRWNLAPIEERWEALEELEKLTRDRSRLLVQTDNIALLRAGDLDVVRVGRAELREEAWWRYGRELARRYRRSRELLWLDVALALTVGFPILRSVGRWKAFSDGIWLGVHRCPKCGASLTGGGTSVRQTRWLSINADESGDIVLGLDCRYCDYRGEHGRLFWHGQEARRILRTAVAYHNFEGGDRKTIDAACDRITAFGSPTEFLRAAARSGTSLVALEGAAYRPAAIALELALNDEDEQQLLRAEMVAIEERWRQEEEIARIMDGELTPVPDLPEIR